MVFRRWATKKSAGSTKNGRDSLPKNLGVKKYGGEVRGSLLLELKKLAYKTFYILLCVFKNEKNGQDYLKKIISL